MDSLATYFSLSLFTAAFVCVAVAVHVWLRRDRIGIGATPFICLMLAVGAWAGAYGMEISAHTLSAKLLWAKVQYIGILALPITWLIFALRYAGFTKWPRPGYSAILAIVTCGTLAAIWTNEHHALFWTHAWLDESISTPLLVVNPGPLFWANAVYSYGLMLLGTALLVQPLMRSRQLYRQQG